MLQTEIAIAIAIHTSPYFLGHNAPEVEVLFGIACIPATEVLIDLIRLPKLKQDEVMMFSRALV
jgi:hypothetical protein